MARFFIRSTSGGSGGITSDEGRPRVTRLVQRATLHVIAGDVENITRVRGFVSTNKNFIETTYFDKLNLRWYRSITLFDEQIQTPQVGPSYTANLWHSLNSSQRFLQPKKPKTTFISSKVHHRPPQRKSTNNQSNTILFRAG